MSVGARARVSAGADRGAGTRARARAREPTRDGAGDGVGQLTLGLSTATLTLVQAQEDGREDGDGDAREALDFGAHRFCREVSLMHIHNKVMEVNVPFFGGLVFGGMGEEMRVVELCSDAVSPRVVDRS